jgi:2-polyprenyl-3-methyl-5-hydroxy-6-metoxy-1,4-benzoquinol methylase
MAHPDDYSSFYNKKIQGIDLKLAYFGYLQFRPFFRGGSCLELGPATGYMTQYLLSDFDNLTVVEGSGNLLDQIPAHNKLVKVHSLFEQYEPGKSYDTIVMSHVLEHIEHPVTLLSRIRRWMHKDSVFILAVPNAKSFHRLAAVKMGMLETEYQLNERDRALGHFRVYDMQSLKNDAVSAGFRVADSGGMFLKFFSNDQIEKCMDDKILNAYFELGNDFKESSAEIFLILQL